MTLTERALAVVILLVVAFVLALHKART